MWISLVEGNIQLRKDDGILYIVLGFPPRKQATLNKLVDYMYICIFFYRKKYVIWNLFFVYFSY